MAKNRRRTTGLTHTKMIFLGPQGRGLQFSYIGILIMVTLMLRFPLDPTPFSMGFRLFLEITHKFVIGNKFLLLRLTEIFPFPSISVTWQIFPIRHFFFFKTRFSTLGYYIVCFVLLSISLPLPLTLYLMQELESVQKWATRIILSNRDISYHDA